MIFIKYSKRWEIKYMTWLANVVLVKKSNRKWRMCVDYTDLNKNCLKNLYLLPSMDKLIDNSLGFKFFTSMDAYSRYNQIPLHHSNQEKISFTIERENDCYKVMSFGLKNVGATW